VESITLDKDVEILTDKNETIVTVYTPKGSSSDDEETTEETEEATAE
jgi:hypothetical protein